MSFEHFLSSPLPSFPLIWGFSLMCASDSLAMIYSHCLAYRWSDIASEKFLYVPLGWIIRFKAYRINFSRYRKLMRSHWTKRCRSSRSQVRSWTFQYWWTQQFLVDWSLTSMTGTSIWASRRVSRSTNRRSSQRFDRQWPLAKFNYDFRWQWCCINISPIFLSFPGIHSRRWHPALRTRGNSSDMPLKALRSLTLEDGWDEQAFISRANRTIYVTSCGWTTSEFLTTAPSLDYSSSQLRQLWCYIWEPLLSLTLGYTAPHSSLSLREFYGNEWYPLKRGEVDS